MEDEKGWGDDEVDGMLIVPTDLVVAAQCLHGTIPGYVVSAYLMDGRH